MGERELIDTLRRRLDQPAAPGGASGERREAMKPILFNTDMVRAILGGRKTVTRRVVKPQPPAGVTRLEHGAAPGRWRSPGKDVWVEIRAPYQPGDILWVRETWSRKETGPYLYKADNDMPQSFLGWRPSIHMPREAARIFLRVTGVRAERLQELTLKDAEMEGMDLRGPMFTKFVELWNSTIPKNPNKFKRYPYCWEDNPWVWVIEFERISKP